jgi:hypothetical protein
LSFSPPEVHLLGKLDTWLGVDVLFVSREEIFREGLWVAAQGARVVGVPVYRWML